MAQANDNTARLRWRCRRGTREMDLLLLRFLEQDYPRLNSREQSLFGSLLDEADPDIYAWITGQAQPANPDYLPLIEKISPIPHHPSLYGKGANTVIPDTNCPVSTSTVIPDTNCLVSTSTVVPDTNGLVSTSTVVPDTNGPVSTSTVVPDRDCPVSTSTVVPDRDCPVSTSTVVLDRDCPVSRDRDVNEHEVTQ